MPAVQIIDTFPAYLSFWSAVLDREIEQQIECWRSEYMALWPEPRQKLFDDYAGEGLHWIQIAKEKVISYLQARLPAMKGAHTDLMKIG